MTDAEAGGRLPKVLARAFGEDGSLGRGFARGRDSALDLFPPGARTAAGTNRPGADPVDAPARLDPGAFGVSSPEARDRLHRVLDGEGVVVTTGQQPLLFLGPLFVVYKLLGALEIARRYESAGVPALPVFWIGGDDHDWPEVGRTRLLDPGNELRTLRLEPPEGREGRATGPTPLPERITDLVDEFVHLLPDTDFIEPYLECLRDAYRPGRTLADAFGSALEGVVGNRRFAWLDAASPAVRGAAAPLLDRLLADPGETERTLREGHERVDAAGYDPQMPHEEGGLPIFVDRPEGRTRLFREETGEVRLGRTGPTTAVETLREELEADPGRFSPHAALRPVQESWLLPVGATVLGPSEVAYWAQLPPLFEALGVTMPEIRPRPSWTLLEGKVGKVLRKLDAEPDDFRDGGERLSREITDRGRPEAVEEALTEARRDMGTALGRVEEAVAEELPGIRSAVGAARHQAFEAIDRLADAVDDRIRERESVLLSQVRKAAVHLHPRGEPQERVQSPFYYLARYGPELLDRIEERTGAWGTGHGDAGATSRP